MEGKSRRDGRGEGCKEDGRILVKVAEEEMKGNAGRWENSKRRRCWEVSWNLPQVILLFLECLEILLTGKRVLEREVRIVFQATIRGRVY